MAEPAHVLIVDDQADNLLILEDLLGPHYAVHTATDGFEALDYVARGGPLDLILLDVMMPGLDGYEVCRRLKANPRTSEVPVIFLSGLESDADEERGLSIGAEDFIHKPFSPPVVLARVRNHLKLSTVTLLLRERNGNLERMVEERTRALLRQAEALSEREKQLISAQDATITAFCALAEARDNETGNHLRRTQNYVRALAQRLSRHPKFAAELSDEVIEMLFKSAPLHDVGKVAIPDAILLKPGKLDPREWEIMKQHAKYGRDAIASAEDSLRDAGRSFLCYAREIAYSHHERWDGSGYPQRLKGEQIPLSARLMAVADVYDALISRRVYKPAFPHDQAVQMIAAERGAHFDPDVVDAFVAITDHVQAIARRYADDEEPTSRDPANAPRESARVG